MLSICYFFNNTNIFWSFPVLFSVIIGIDPKISAPIRFLSSSPIQLGVLFKLLPLKLQIIDQGGCIACIVLFTKNKSHPLFTLW